MGVRGEGGADVSGPLTRCGVGSFIVIGKSISGPEQKWDIWVTIITVTMVTDIAVARMEAQKLATAPGWVILYGRRKVGKTYLARKVFHGEMYILILRGGGAIIENGPLGRTDDATLVQDVIVEALKDGRKVIVDEFHRLPSDFLERVQIVHPNGKLILLGSSFHLSRSIMSKGSPVLGLFSEVRLSLVGPDDILLGLSKEFDPVTAMSLAPYLRDPWTLRFARDDPVRSLIDVIEYSKGAIPALVGEAFLEEDRFLSQMYEGVIRSLARGKTTLAEISDILHSRRLIDRSDPSRIRQYVLNMEAMDLIERVPVYNGKGNRYSLRSKIMELHYHIDERYGIDRDLPLPFERIVQERIPHAVESFTGELLAAILGGTYRYHSSKEDDIDIIITRKNRPVLVGVVKWGSRVSGKDLSRFLEVSSPFDCRKVMITRNRLESNEVENLVPQDLIDMARKKARVQVR